MNLLRYLLGKHDFYKVEKENGKVSIQSYNFSGTHGWGVKNQARRAACSSRIEGKQQNNS